MQTKKTVDDYLQAHPEWQAELSLLRATVKASGLEETIKWGAPTYTLKGKNVVGLGAYKAYIGLWFFQGALLQDKHHRLVNAQEGKTKALRQWRFNSLDEIDAGLVSEYLQEAIANQAAGKQIKPARNVRLVMPSELTAALASDARLKQAFASLTPGKQREYADYISDAKRDATKVARLEKITPMILAGAGLYDKYKNC